MRSRTGVEIRPALLLPVLGLAMLAMSGASLAVGYAQLPLGRALADAVSGQVSLPALVLLELRLPRAMLGALVGFSLGMAGAAMQGLMRNPLAEPGVVGISSAAALGAVAAFYSGLSATVALALPLGGIAGALLATLVLFILLGRGASTTTLILAGVALNSFAGAATALALNLAPNPYAALEIVFWLMGSLADRSMSHVWLVLPLMLSGWLLMASTAPALDALSLGEETAASLGFDLTWLRARLIGGAVLAVASAAPAGRAPPRAASGRERSWRRDPGAGCRSRRAPCADTPRAQARRRHRADWRSLPFRAGPASAAGGAVMAIVGQGISIALGGHPALTGVDAELRRGEVLGIIGPNGAGKTTLLRVIAGLLTPDDGHVLYDGVTARQLGRHALARRIAFLAQDGAAAWSLSVEALVGLGRLPHRKPFGGASEADHATVAKAMALCHVATFAGRTLGTLSGGERRRVMLARALAVEADYLLADEPLAGLDPGHQLDTLQLLRTVAAGGTAIAVVLHDLTLAARFCDRLLLIHRGTRAAEGEPAIVLDDDRLAEAFGVTALRGSHESVRFILPWRTTTPSRSDP